MTWLQLRRFAGTRPSVLRIGASVPTSQQRLKTLDDAVSVVDCQVTPLCSVRLASARLSPRKLSAS